MATPEEIRNVGIGLIVGGVVAGVLSAVLFWVSSNEHWTVGPLVFACIAALLAVYLVGYGIKKVADTSST